MMTYHYVYKEGKSDKEPVLILFHGTGGDEYDLLPVAEQIAPNAAVLSLRGTRTAYGMNRFFNRTADGKIDVADLIQETGTLHQFLTGFIRDKELTGRTLLAIGFSNGANLIISYLHQTDNVFKGAALFHGMDYRPETPFSDLHETLLFVAAAVNDPFVPKDEMERMTAGFKTGHADVMTHWSESGHALTDEEIHAAKKWVKSFDPHHTEMTSLLKEINRLARLARKQPLTQSERILQQNLREQYLHLFRNGFRQHLLNIKLVDEDGRDRTPQKAKAIQDNLDREKDREAAEMLAGKMKVGTIMKQILGLHHVSIVTSNAKKNVDFYTKVLGMRLVKKTVNQDDISVYHLYLPIRKEHRARH